ncbi:MAG: hypothetical protein EOP87_18225 [Verrucomicrobiaceae bacterium]|nr:MAG: hypothetical protein EOP87_18225 [Verrucomicrobiaceae bacterium]
MTQNASPITPLAWFQVIVVVLGFICLRVTTFPLDAVDSARWSFLPRVVLYHGYLLLGVPLVWIFTVAWLELRHGDTWSRRWTVVTGLIMLVSLAALFCQICSYAHRWVWGF